MFTESLLGKIQMTLFYPSLNRLCGVLWQPLSLLIKSRDSDDMQNKLRKELNVMCFPSMLSVAMGSAAQPLHFNPLFPAAITKLPGIFFDFLMWSFMFYSSRIIKDMKYILLISIQLFWYTTFFCHNILLD